MNPQAAGNYINVKHERFWIHTLQCRCQGKLLGNTQPCRLPHKDEMVIGSDLLRQLCQIIRCRAAADREKQPNAIGIKRPIARASKLCGLPDELTIRTGSPTFRSRCVNFSCRHGGKIIATLSP